LTRTWVLGIVDSTGRIRLEVCSRRDAATSHQLIRRYVRVGSTIHTDEWRPGLPRIDAVRLRTCHCEPLLPIRIQRCAHAAHRISLALDTQNFFPRGNQTRTDSYASIRICVEKRVRGTVARHVRFFIQNVRCEKIGWGA